ncbi:MAG: isoaspartyl peptidase/L-asparaginase [Planctomycetota bacterium]|nr:MAG: isoaspartyl peptidase/L-asparaginase [Planctomycetota bacterium]
MTQGLLMSMMLLVAMAVVCRSAEPPVKDVVLAIHGGTAGPKESLTPEREKAVRADMKRALEAGYAILERDGKALDAVEAAIRVMEDSPEFNAGKGAVFTHEGQVEMDASIMEGNTRGAGAVASVTVIKNPISAARAVMERTKHVLLSGRGAEVFATKEGLETVDPAYFWTERRWQQIQKVWEQEKQQAESLDRKNSAAVDQEREPWGTVGAIALDNAGDLAAGTSTGGRSNKMYGRVGDSPIIGAGTFAENGVCAVSGTGEGEYFIRFVAAYDIAALMKYKNLPVESAAAEVVFDKLKAAGGEGGVIALDAEGRFAAPYNTPGMYRGYVTRDGQIEVRLYAD